MIGFRDWLAADKRTASLLNALPAGIFFLNTDFRVVGLNESAEMVFGPEAEVVGVGPGDALHCINALVTGQGCGTSPECESCLLRRTTFEALADQKVYQREVAVKVRVGGQDEKRLLLISAAPYRWEQTPLAAVLLQDVTRLHRLRGLIPICASCNKIRYAKKDWEQLEAYIEEHSFAEFTHGLCPDCLERLSPEGK